MKRPALFLLLCAALACSCHHRAAGPASSDAGSAAVACYELLRDGDARAFVGHMASAGSDTTAFFKQMEAVVGQYIDQTRQELGGIDSVSLSRQQLQAGGRAADVYLILKFGNGQSEEVNVTMLRHQGRWLMR